jgi:hypothetical protein
MMTEELIDMEDIDDAPKTVYQLENEVEDLYRRGEETRLEHRRELLALRTTLAALAKSLDDLGESYKMGLYQKAMRDVYMEGQDEQHKEKEIEKRQLHPPDELQDASSYSGSSQGGSNHTVDCPQPYVVKIQAQLCHALHSNEIQLKQAHIVKRRNKHLAKYLQKQKQELSRESEERKGKLSKRIDEETAKWEEELESLKARVDKQKDDIVDLRKQLGISGRRILSPILSPRKVLGSFSDSFRNLMDGISLKDLKNMIPPPSLELLQTPPSLSKSKLWIDLKREEEVKEQQALEGVGDTFRSGSFVRRSNAQGRRSSSFAMHRDSSRTSAHGSLNGSSHHSTDHYTAPNRQTLMRSLGIGTRSSMLFGTSDFEEDKDDFIDSPLGGDGFAVETPASKRQSVLTNTSLGKSLLELVNSDDTSLSPTSQNIKKLSAEVFGM